MVTSTSEPVFLANSSSLLAITLIMPVHSSIPVSYTHLFSEMDRYLFGEGTHYEIYKLMGAHPTTQRGKDGVYFAVWAPHAESVSVVGDFNKWDPDKNVMKCDNDMGIYQLFVPKVREGDLYKFCITTYKGKLLLDVYKRQDDSGAAQNFQRADIGYGTAFHSVRPVHCKPAGYPGAEMGACETEKVIKEGRRRGEV